MKLRLVTAATAATFAALMLLGASGAAADTLPTSYTITPLDFGSVVPGGEFTAPAIAPDGKTLYIPDFNADGEIFVVPLADPGQTTTIKTDSSCDPISTAVAPNGLTLYVGCEEGGLDAVSLAHPASYVRITDAGSSSVGQPTGLAVSPNGQLLYIANDGTGKDVEVADVSGSGAANDTVIGTITATNASIAAPTDLTISPNGDTLYVTNSSTNQIAVVDLAGVTLSDPSTTTDASPILDDSAIAEAGATVSADGLTLYTADLVAFKEIDNMPEVVPATTVSIAGLNPLQTATAGVAGDSFTAPEGIVASPDGNTVYVVSGQVKGGVEAVTIPSTGVTLSTPKITGSDKVGGKLKLTASIASQPVTPFVASTLSDQWLVGGEPVVGATGTSFVPTAADAGKTVSVRVLASGDVGYSGAVATAAETASVAKGTLTTHTPTISGSAKVGKTLTASVKAWGPAPVKLSYQWYASGKKISGATKKTLKLTAKVKGKKITVAVGGSKTGYTKATKTSKATGNVTG